MQNIIVVKMSDGFGCCNSVGTGFCWRLLQMCVCTYMSVPILQFLDFLQCLMCKCLSHHRADGQVLGAWCKGGLKKRKNPVKFDLLDLFWFCNVWCAIVQVPFLPSFRRTGWWWPVERAQRPHDSLSCHSQFLSTLWAGQGPTSSQFHRPTWASRSSVLVLRESYVRTISVKGLSFEPAPIGQPLLAWYLSALSL